MMKLWHKGKKVRHFTCHETMILVWGFIIGKLFVHVIDIFKTMCGYKWSDEIIIKWMRDQYTSMMVVSENVYFDKMLN